MEDVDLNSKFNMFESPPTGNKESLRNRKRDRTKFSLSTVHLREQNESDCNTLPVGRGQMRTRQHPVESPPIQLASGLTGGEHSESGPDKRIQNLFIHLESQDEYENASTESTCSNSEREIQIG